MQLGIRRSGPVCVTRTYTAWAERLPENEDPDSNYSKKEKPNDVTIHFLSKAATYRHYLLWTAAKTLTACASGAIFSWKLSLPRRWRSALGSRKRDAALLEALIGSAMTLNGQIPPEKREWITKAVIHADVTLGIPTCLCIGIQQGTTSKQAIYLE